MIKTYEDWENSLDQNYVRQLSPDAWDLTGSAFEAGQQSQQAKIDELQARVPEGYVVVPMETLEEALSWANCASSESWTGEQQDEIDKHCKVIEKAMIEAVEK